MNSTLVRPCSWKTIDGKVHVRCYNIVQEDLTLVIDPSSLTKDLKPYSWITIGAPESVIINPLRSQLESVVVPPGIPIKNVEQDLTIPTPETYLYWTMNDEYLVGLFVGIKVNGGLSVFRLTTREDIRGHYTVDSREEMIECLINKALILGVTREIFYNTNSLELPNTTRINFNSYCNRYMSQLVDRSVEYISGIVLGVRIPASDLENTVQAIYKIDQELDVMGTLEGLCNMCTLLIEDVVEMEDNELVTAIIGDHYQLGDSYFFLQKKEREEDVIRYDYTLAIIDALRYTDNIKLPFLFALLPTRICMLIFNSSVISNESRDRFRDIISEIATNARIIELNLDSLFASNNPDQIDYLVEKEVMNVRIRSEDKVMVINSGSLKLGFDPCIPA